MQLKRIVSAGALAILWGVTVLAATQIRHLNFLDDHSICGPWGCGPPTIDVIAIHTVWLMILAPPLLVFGLWFPARPSMVRRLGHAMLAIAVVSGLGVCTWQWFVWLPQAGAWSQPYIWRRCLFCVMTAVDWPIFQLGLLGSLLLIVSRFGSRSSTNNDLATSESVPNAHTRT